MADKTNSHETFMFKFALSAVAAVVAESVTYPLDLTKTRLQIQGEQTHCHHAFTHQASEGVKEAASHRGMLKTAVGIVREEGLPKLWQGVTPALYRHVVYTGARMGCYEYLRENVLKKDKDGSFPLWKAVIGGLSAGAFGQFIASPTDLVKVQMQMEGKRRLEGHPPRVKSTWHAFSSLRKEGGVRGLWRGCVPNVQRAALVNMGDLATYDTAKHFLLRHTSLQDNYVTHSLASGMSGIVAALVGTPADVVKTRIMNQPTKNGKGLLYTSSLNCAVKTVQNEGFLALYKGLLPIWARMAPWSLTFWLTYEKVRKTVGTSSF
ncbi:mitochondrial uncoupling protein 4 [Lingula anatina]|uniref:Mitochondrial uncoupling protein 4 n=1 Tax=Lingula anatina TaxID=7574 RepID=A0A1S3ITC3_LINAN|nr:mitochondrial uncoupling protein 4 [Lingula anatina]|eukprot:XP_013401460.2 mitochondrial uncoupling protein 4 [Lingula anatina]